MNDSTTAYFLVATCACALVVAAVAIPVMPGISEAFAEAGQYEPHEEATLFDLIPLLLVIFSVVGSAGLLIRFLQYRFGPVTDVDMEEE